ncbi:MAG: MMPL family transporter [Microbacteriaceae bacterium]|nr:MMPL family transporter [Microbacteriaceae bacterium]
MAALLYRLGRLAARRAWIVLSAWIVALGLAVGGFLAFGGTLSANFNIPGTATDRVTQQLAEALPDYAGAAATVVFRAEDGAFSAEQQDAIAGLLAEVEEQDGVAAVVDPFDTEAQRADQAQQLEDARADIADGEQRLADGEAQLADGQAQLDAAQEQLDASRRQLDDGQAQLDLAIAQAKEVGLYYDVAAEQFAVQQAQLDAGRAQLEAGQDQLDAQQQTIDDGRADLEDGKAELADGREQLALGERLLDAASGLRSVSEDGATALGTVLFESDFFTLSSETKAAVAGVLDAAAIPGVTLTYSSEIAASFDGLLGAGEIVGILLALVVLLVTLRAILPALLPMVSSILGVGVGIAASLAFSSVTDMSSVTPALGVMLGLAVGIDYALFIVNRHRRQLRQGMELHESIGLANGTAGSAVVFAGATVVVALLALTVTGIPFLGTMGIVAAFCVLVAVLCAVTLVPALLRLVGMRALNRRARAAAQAAAAAGHAESAPRAPKPMRTGWAIGSVVVGVIGLLVLAAPVLSLRLGLLNASSEPVESTQYQTYKTIEQEFGAGRGAGLLVVATPDSPVADDDLRGVQADFVDFLMAQDGVVAAVPIAATDAGDLLAFQVVPEEGSTSASTEALVHALRDATPPAGIDHVGVAGSASAAIDISEKLAGALPLYLALIAGIAVILLILVFRSILVPLLAAAGFVLSLFAALGAVTAVYQWGWLGSLFDVHDPGPVLSFAPILIIGMLFGLAMDYQIFLVAGMREAYVHGAPPRVAVMSGLRSGRAVVTAAAIIMASVFGGFVFSHIGTIRPLGFGLAVGVLFDAFVVRMLITPAVIHLLGKAAWWMPKWLDRILPNVDVEGAALERQHAHV